jgi:single-strand DNA-binding protein
MSSLNKVLLIGNLGRDPELKHSPNSSVTYCNFSLATTDRRKDQSGQWVDQTEWHNITTFGNIAENCNRYLKKGSMVYVEGKISTSKWKDQNGVDRTTVKIVAEKVQFLSRREGGAERGANEGNYNANYSNNRSNNNAYAEPDFSDLPEPTLESVTFDDDDIPF